MKINKPLNNHKILVNTKIHEKAKLSKSQFIEKVKNVKGIRTFTNEHFISFYITSLKEKSNLKKFHELINNGNFEITEDYYLFAVGVADKLYEWFKNTKFAVIERQITNWLAATYFFETEKQYIMEQQIYNPTLEAMKEIINEYYIGYEKLINYDKNSISEEKYLDNLLEEEKRRQEKYLEVCNKFYFSSPPDFLSTPVYYSQLSEYGVNNRYNFEIIEAYFTDKDWDNIINKGSDDILLRAESRTDFWEKWKDTFVNFEYKKSHVYSYFFDDLKEEKKANKKREYISAEVKREVWKRDEGKCVICKSNENLEYDHIIPVSKGGSSTVRNLQLLCEKCNRDKRDKIE